MQHHGKGTLNSGITDQDRAQCRGAVLPHDASPAAWVQRSREDARGTLTTTRINITGVESVDLMAPCKFLAEVSWPHEASCGS